MQKKLFTDAEGPLDHAWHGSIAELDLKNWKAFPEIITDSLWLIPERDKTGAHTGYLHGNFIPQIPRQAMLRFTRKGEVVVDPFLGSGTTLIEGPRATVISSGSWQVASETGALCESSDAD